MKILLSAYACEPNRGSEQGVGWGWALELARTNEVWVLTRDRNQPRIEGYLAEHPDCAPPGLHFIYVGVPKALTFWKKGNRGIRLYYMLWQRAAYAEAKKWHERIRFDCVQHVTFVSYTQPTYLYRLGVPMVWGPVSGGENIPPQISIRMTGKERLAEGLRRLSQSLALRWRPIRETMRQSTLILAATEETRAKIPEVYQGKTHVLPAIGLERAPQGSVSCLRRGQKRKIVMAGRLIYWKAFDIGINAFMKIAGEYEHVELHILGEGNQKRRLMALAEAYLNTRIFFDGLIPHDEMDAVFRDADLFLNTTLRDSGCMAMMEALCAGLPCIALDTGGPQLLGQGNPSVTLVPVSDYDRTVSDVARELRRCLSREDGHISNTIAQETYANRVRTVCELLRGEQA